MDEDCLVRTGIMQGERDVNCQVWSIFPTSMENKTILEAQRQKTHWVLLQRAHWQLEKHLETYNIQTVGYHVFL
jgi:hypothetical protein